CQPHKALGMVGDVIVNESGQPPGGGGGGGPILPSSAKTIGVAAVGGMVSILGLTYFFMKYGGDYREVEE
ncbi:MAG: halocyanin, partial [Halobacteriaceae archaeon]